jgi:hypothetical protein
MKNGETTVDTEDRYYNVHQASKIICGVCEKTLWTWAKEGKTSFGFELRTKREPIEHHRSPRRGEAPPRNPRNERVLILEADVFALKAILEAEGRTQPAPWSPAELASLGERAVRVTRRRGSKCYNHHL